MNKILPKQFIAGESLSWEKCFDEYLPSGGWTLKYSFRGAGAGFDVGATAEGDVFVLNVATNVTAESVPGKYSYQAFVERSGEKHLVDAGEVSILPNLSSLSSDATFDGRSQVKKTLDAIDAQLAGKASLDQQSYVIGNRQLVRIPISELLKLRDKYALLYAAERRAARIKKGGSFFKTVLVRMRDK